MCCCASLFISKLRISKQKEYSTTTKKKKQISRQRRKTFFATHTKNYSLFLRFPYLKPTQQQQNHEKLCLPTLVTNFEYIRRLRKRNATQKNRNFLLTSDLCFSRERCFHLSKELKHSYILWNKVNRE